MFQRPIGGQGGDGDVGHCIVGIHIRKSKIGRRQNNSCVFVGCNSGVGCRWGIICADYGNHQIGRIGCCAIRDCVAEAIGDRFVGIEWVFCASVCDIAIAAVGADG